MRRRRRRHQIIIAWKIKWDMFLYEKVNPFIINSISSAWNVTYKHTQFEMENGGGCACACVYGEWLHTHILLWSIGRFDIYFGEFSIEYLANICQIISLYIYIGLKLFGIVFHTCNLASIFFFRSFLSPVLNYIHTPIRAIILPDPWEMFTTQSKWKIITFGKSGLFANCIDERKENTGAKRHREKG